METTDPSRKPSSTVSPPACSLSSRVDRLNAHGNLASTSLPQANILSCLLCDQSSTASFNRKQYIDHVLSTTTEMHCMDVLGHHGCVNSIDFSNHGEEYMVTGGDDRRVLVWRVADLIQDRGLRSTTMATTHMSNIFTVDFSCDNAFIYSGGDDAEVIKHDFSTGQCVSTFSHLDSVYCIDAHPTSPSVVVTASEDGCVYIVDTREPTNFMLTQDMVLCESTKSYQCVSVNPVEPCLVAVSSGYNGTSLYDTRQRKQVLSYKSTDWLVSRENSVSVCFNKTGRQLFALYRQSPPCLFDIWETKPTHKFIDQTGCYRNRVTLKSGCFMGPNDEYVVSGSDDFRVYIWKIPKYERDMIGEKSTTIFDSLFSQVEPHLILPGHRSIVNQVRYSNVHKVMSTAGVEKVVKVWSHLPLNNNDVLQKSRAPPSRQRFTSEQVHNMAHSDEPLEPVESTEEDPTVLALFDTLVDQDESGQLLTTSSDSTPSSMDIGDDDSYFLLDHDSDGDLLSSSDSENMAFGAMPSSSRSFWLDLHHRHYLGSSSDGSTPSELSFANTSSIEPPWSDADMEELDREIRGDGDSDIEALNEFDRRAKRNWKTHEFDCDDPISPQVGENVDNTVPSNSSAPAQRSVMSPQKPKNKASPKSSSTSRGTSSNSGKKTKKGSPSKIAGSSIVSDVQMPSVFSAQGQSTSSNIGGPEAHGSESSSTVVVSSTKKTRAKAKRKRAPRRPCSNASSYDPICSDADMEELDREIRGDGDSDIEALNEFDRRAKRNWRTHEFDCDDPISPQVGQNIDNTVPSNSSAPAQSSVVSCPQKSKNKSSPKCPSASRGTSSNSGKKATPSKISGSSSVSGLQKPSVSSTQGQSTSSNIGQGPNTRKKTKKIASSKSSGSQKPSTQGQSTSYSVGAQAGMASTANGASSSTRKSRTTSRRQLIMSQSQSGPNYEEYDRDDFLKTKPTTSFYSKKK